MAITKLYGFVGIWHPDLSILFTTQSQALVARNYPHPPFWSVYIFIFNNISLYFHLFYLILTCSCPFSYNLMLTSPYMSRPQALVARNYPPPFLTFCLHVYFQWNFFISVLFHLFYLILTCSCLYWYNIIFTATYMCRPQLLVARNYLPLFLLSVYIFIFNKISLFLYYFISFSLF